MTYYNARFERERKERTTPERILELARKHGRFSVSLRWRDDWLRRRCLNLRKAKLLRGGRKIVSGQLVFFPVETSA